jgi:magnesium transporter
MIFFTELQGLPTFDVKGELLGRLQDVLVDPSQTAFRIAAYYVKTPKKSVLCITHQQMQSLSVRAAQTSVSVNEIRCYSPDDSLISVRKDVLDQQIIDVNHRKVERVNDVDFDIRPTNVHTELRILAVNVGLRAATRRLLRGVISKHKIRSVTSVLPSRIIPWEFVNLIEPDQARRLKLKISYDRLAALHPADLADILEELSREEQRAVIESLDDETAAQALSEIPTHMQAVLLESIPPAKAADIVEEMPPDEAADVLHEMPPETTAEVLAGMEKDEAQEVQELLGFEEETAGALMTTEFVAVTESASLTEAVQALKSFEGPVESVHQICLTDPQGVLSGVVPISRILLADASTPLKEISLDPVISVHSHADEREVVELFHKYNLVALPVVDENQYLLGLVTADDVLEVVVKHR